MKPDKLTATRHTVTKCPDCRAPVVEARDANTGDALLLDPRVTDEGFHLDACCSAHAPVARPGVPGTALYAVHEHGGS